MRVVALIVALLGSLGAAQARPIVIEESAVITPPAGANYVRFGYEVGTNGEYALVVADHPKPADAFLAQTFDALLYRRVDDAWVFQRILARGSRSEEDFSYFPVIIGMKGDLASTALGEGGSSIHRFDGTDWVPAGSGAGLQEDVSIDGERILYGVGEYWNGQVFEPDGAGGWTSQYLPGQPRCCDDEFWGGPVDLSGDRAILGTPGTFDLEPQEIPIYQRIAGAGWQLQAKLQVPTGVYRLGAEVALHGDNAIVNGVRSGPYVWTNGYFYGDPPERLQTVSSYARDAGAHAFAKDGNLLLASSHDPDFASAVINVFRQDSSGHYEHLAILKPRSGSGLSGNFEIDNGVVVAGSNGRAVVFRLPSSFTAPWPRYDRFEGGNGGNWTPSAGSQFTVVRPTSVNGVYRQSSTAGDAHSLFSNTSWVNQAIEADVRPTAFDGNDRWVGVATRYADEQNYYYVTLRSSGSVQLKRMRDGVFTTLASAPLAVQTNRTYRVRLESLGSTHRVYVDGALHLTAVDAGPQLPGNAAVIMYRAAADFDNVVVSPSRRSTIFADSFTGTTEWGDWSHNGSGQWSLSGDAYVQSSVAVEARALIGTPRTTDQIVAARVRPVAFASSNNGQERWIGIIARYADEQNYYYLTLRNGNSLSLRKLVNGSIHVLGTVPVNVNTSSWYALRLEVLATTLRAYLGDTMVMQVVDTSHAQGRTGLMTYKAAAQFDDYAAYQP